MILHHLKIPKHMISIVYTGALGLPNCPVDHCLFFWGGVSSPAQDECKWCLQRSIPTEERYSCSKTLWDPHRKHFPSLCLCTLATRNPLGVFGHQLVLYLSLYRVFTALSFWFHHHDSLSLYLFKGTHRPFSLNYPKHTQPHTVSRSPAYHLRDSGRIMEKSN